MPNQEKTVNLKISIWYNEDDESIHISCKEPSFISTINDKEGNARCHKHLFSKFKLILESEGKFTHE